MIWRKMSASVQWLVIFNAVPLLLLPILLSMGASARTKQRGEATRQESKTEWRFAFGTGQNATGYLSVLPDTIYTKERGYGYVGSSPTIGEPDRPFLFTVDLPEGNYTVSLTLGDSKQASATTVKAEARRLMLERVETGRGKETSRSFTVNVRNSRLKSGEQVRLKADEQGSMDWDGQLTLEFSNAHPALRRMTIVRADKSVPTLFIAGDSTVCDQPREPWCAWGQMLPRFFKEGVAVANYAESGESLRSFVSERRLAKISETIKAGDYLFIQFGHNDQKQKGDGVGAFTTYKADLKRFIAEARSHDATPVLVTPMNRRTFGPDGKITNSLGDYPEAVRQAATEEKVALIDLNAMSKTLYETLGPENSARAFVHYPANTFPGQTKELKDNTHFNSYGAYELARCIVEGIRANRLPLASLLTPDARPFDPAHPDPVETWKLPASALTDLVKPEGK